MTIHKITASDPAAAPIVTTIGGEQGRCRLIEGVGYTVLESMVHYAERQGFTVSEVDQVPDEHRQHLARLNDWSHEIRLQGRDAADPESHYRFDNTLHVDTVRAKYSTTESLDVRDVLDGTVSSDDIKFGTIADYA